MKIVLTPDEKPEVERLLGVMGIKLEEIMFDDKNVIVDPGKLVNAIRHYIKWVNGFPSFLVADKIRRYQEIFVKYFTGAFYKAKKKAS